MRHTMGGTINGVPINTAPETLKKKTEPMVVVPEAERDTPVDKNKEKKNGIT